jgi:hypothetical protein
MSGVTPTRPPPLREFLPLARPFYLALLCLGLGFSGIARAAEPAGKVGAMPPQVCQTVGRAVGYLLARSTQWLATRKCAACHHVAFPLWAMGEAERPGYVIDKKWFDKTAEGTFGGREQMIAAKLIYGPKDAPDPRPEGRGVRMGLVFMAVAAETFAAPSAGQKHCLQVTRDNIDTTQLADGSWNFLDDRPPIHESRASDAAWILFALGGLAHARPTAAERAEIDKGMARLERTKLADSHQGKVLKVLLAIRAGKSRDELRPALDELLALQRADGGWRQTAEMASDAYATGQTLYVLSLAGHSAEPSGKIRPQIKRAIEFLVATQKADGSWPMMSRPKPGGKPAKLLTPITTAATSWATLGLVRLVPQK